MLEGMTLRWTQQDDHATVHASVKANPHTHAHIDGNERHINSQLGIEAAHEGRDISIAAKAAAEAKSKMRLV